MNKELYRGLILGFAVGFASALAAVVIFGCSAAYGAENLGQVLSSDPNWYDKSDKITKDCILIEKFISLTGTSEIYKCSGEFKQRRIRGIDTGENKLPECFFPTERYYEHNQVYECGPVVTAGCPSFESDSVKKALKKPAPKKEKKCRWEIKRIYEIKPGEYHTDGVQNIICDPVISGKGTHDDPVCRPAEMIYVFEHISREFKTWEPFGGDKNMIWLKRRVCE